MRFEAGNSYCLVPEIALPRLFKGGFATHEGGICNLDSPPRTNFRNPRVSLRQHRNFGDSTSTDAKGLEKESFYH
jgi:hypothetical protein